MIVEIFHDAINAVNAAKLYIDSKTDAIGIVSTYADKLKPKVVKIWEQYTTEQK